MPNLRTYAEVSTLLESRRTDVFGALHAEMQEDEVFLHAGDKWAASTMGPYLRAFVVDFKPRDIPLARQIMLTMASAVNNGQTPRVEVSIDKASGIRDYDGSKSSIQRWSRALLRSVRPQLWEAAKQLAGLGCCMLYYGVDKDRYPKQPESADHEGMASYEIARKTARLIDVRSVHPARFYWDRDHETPDDVIIEETLSPAAAASLYPGHDWSTTSQAKDLKRVIYVCPTMYGVWVDGIAVTDGGEETAVNPYGKLWCSMAFSGLGHASFDGDLVHEVQGAVREARGLVASALVAFNSAELLAATGAQPGRDFSGGGSEQHRQSVQSKYSIGPVSTNDLGGEDTGGVVRVEIQPQVERPQFTRDHAEQISGYLGMTGFRGGGLQQGVLSNSNASVNAQDTDLRERKFGAAKASYDAMCSDFVMTVLSMLSDSMESGQTVYLPDESDESGYIGLRVDQVPKAGMRISIDMTPPSMTERQANLQNDLAIQQAGNYRFAWVAARQGIDDHEEQARLGAEEKLFYATADVMAGLVGEVMTELLPIRLGIQRQKDVEKGVVEPPLAGAGQPEQEMMPGGMPGMPPGPHLMPTGPPQGGPPQGGPPQGGPPQGSRMPFPEMSDYPPMPPGSPGY